MSSKKVMGFGTFDAIHPGHRFFLKQLKKLGNELLIVIARDKNVKKIKGFSAEHNEKKRLYAVQNEKIADQVILGDFDNFYQPLLKYQPDVIGLGYDQNADIPLIKSYLPDVKIVRLKALKPGEYKSSFIRN